MTSGKTDEKTSSGKSVKFEDPRNFKDLMDQVESTNQKITSGGRETP